MGYRGKSGIIFLLLVCMQIAGLGDVNKHIFDAVIKGDITNLKKYVTGGADINVKNDEKSTPLHVSVFVNKIEITRYLLKQGAEINAQNNEGQTPLHLAVMTANLQIIRLLLENGADMNIKDSSDFEPLKYLIDYNKKGKVIVNVFNEFKARSITDEQLQKAVSNLQNIYPDKLSDNKRKEKSVELSKSWEIILLSKEKGRKTLKDTVQKVLKNNSNDNFFKLGAASLLWKLGGFDEADCIAKLWKSTPLSYNYNYVFYTAFESASKQNRRAIPMLIPLLKENRGDIFVSAHAMRVSWPLTIEFVWGSLGAKGNPALLKILDTSKNEIEILSALYLLTKSLYIPALPKIREFSKDSRPNIKKQAIKSLGYFGHPLDYEYLMNGLKTSDDNLKWHFLFALYEYEDLRTVKNIIPVLRSKDKNVRIEAINVLGHLLTVESIDALFEYSQKTKNNDEKKKCKKILDGVLHTINLKWESYSVIPLNKKRNMISAVRYKLFKKKYDLKKDDKKLTHTQLVEIINECKKKSRLGSKKYPWAFTRHVIDAIEPGDINLLLDLKGAIYARLSDECLYEVKEVNRVLKIVVRKQYRKVAGLTWHVK